MPITINGTGTIAGVSSTGLSAAQNVVRSQLPAGSVLQVVQTSTTTPVSSTTSAWSDLISLSITPTSSTNKILAFWNTGIYSTPNAIPEIQLLRNSTSVSVNGFFQHINAGSGNPYILSYPSNMYLDSPATTSAITYKLQGRVRAGTVTWFYSDGNGTMNGTFTLMEIAA